MATASDHTELKSNAELHVTGKKNGCLFRCGKSGHKHRENGRELLEAQLKNHYDIDFTRGKPKERFTSILGVGIHGRVQSNDPRYNKTVWFAGVGKNFRTGKKPWENNAHHILPVASIREALTAVECKILLQGRYNLNAGENLIYLPKNQDIGKVMLMLTHPGSHPEYNAHIETLVKQDIKPKLKEAADIDEEGHEPLEEPDIPKLRGFINNKTLKIMKNMYKYAKNRRTAGTTMNNYNPL